MYFARTKTTSASACAKGASTKGQGSGVTPSVIGPGTLTFWTRSQWNNSDGSFHLSVNGVNQSEVGGPFWLPYTQYLGAGQQTLQWVIQMTGTYGNGASASGWLDQVTFVPGVTAPFITTQPLSQSQARVLM